MPDLTGLSLGRYLLTERLGEGGMATVYKAYDTRLDTDVAIKVIRTEILTENTRERSFKRFEREAKALARLTHPFIVSVKDYGEYEGKPYLVMPYLPGGTLKAKLGKPIPWQEALELLLPIAQALDFAHRENMIHRDVKPSNILITADGEPVLTDFGIAKILDLDVTADLTGTGVGIGTPEYMAPEQWTGGATAQSDQYALGVVLYEMLTGHKPYTADTPAAILLKQSNEPLLRPSQYVRDLPDKVEKLLLKAMAKNPADRYKSMAELSKALESLISGTSPPGREQTSTRPERTQEELRTQQHKRVFKSFEEPSVPVKETARKKPRTGWLTVGGAILGIALICGILGWMLGGVIGDLFPTQTATSSVMSRQTATSVQITSPIQTKATSTTTTVIHTPTAASIPEEITDSSGVVMRYVPAGEFTMGSKDGANNEKPTSTIFLKAFYMDKYEVTNALYIVCVDEGICDQPDLGSSHTRYSYFGNPDFDDYPVIYVHWKYAKTYCEWRGARLPTEAEWEKAARGTDERTYPWGEGIDCEKANFSGCTGDTTEVGKYPSGVSIYGIFDLAGNVREWVSSLFRSYPYDPTDGREDMSVNDNRAARGGSWLTGPEDVSTFSRDGYFPTSWSYDLGFRCARDE